MRSIYSVRCGLVLLCITRHLVKSDSQLEPRESDIDRLIPDKQDPAFTTKDYDNSIQPLSVEEDGAPACAPVVYGDQSSFNDDEKITQDDVVRKLHKEWLEKHKTQKNELTEKPPRPRISPDGHGIVDSGDEIRELSKEFRENAPKNARIDLESPDLIKKFGVPNNEIVFKEDAVGDFNELDLQRKNNIQEQHWNARHPHGKFKEYKLGEQWDMDSRQRNQERPRVTILPGEDSIPGYKQDKLQRDIHEEIYGDTRVEAKHEIEIIAEQKDMNDLVPQEKQHNVHKVDRIHNQLKSLLNLQENIENKANFMHYKKMMRIEMKETTNPHQHDKLYGPSCGLKKQNANKKYNRADRKNPLKQKRRKRNVHSTRQVHPTKHLKSKKTTMYFMDIDGRFRDIDVIEEERNRYSSELIKQTTPEWLNYDGYVEPKTLKKFRPRPTLNYNRVPKEPLDYGSYDKSAHWRMLTEIFHNATLPPKFYESLSIPELPNTKEAYDVCRENFTTSECFRYPDISRLRDTRERKFMRKYYKRDYPDMDDDD